MAVRQTYKVWTKAEVQTLQRSWGCVTAADLAEKMGRTVSGLRHKARELGLRAPTTTRHRHGLFGCNRAGIKKRCWTTDEVAYLELNYGVQSLTMIARHLGRSPGTVAAKASDLGIRRWDNSLTVPKVAAICGVPRSRALRWVKRGYIVARRYGEAGHFIVAEEELCRALGARPPLIDISVMPDSWYRDRLLAEAR